MKKIILILILILLSGCTNKVEENRFAYLDYKRELLKQEEFNEEEINFKTFFNIIREDEETVNYNITIDNPNQNMYDVKALLIHDYYEEEVYPQVGILDDPVKLLKDSKDKIILSGTIKTIEDIKDVKFKLYLEYKDEENNLNKIYYQVLRG